MPVILTETAEQKFWRCVTKTDQCWEWNGITDMHGFGLLKLGRKYIAYAHLFSYRLHGGKADDGVIQTCENRLCVKPSHLATRTVEERFWRLVDKSGECWLWLGTVHPKGAGTFRARRGKRGGISAHRFSWQLINGPTARPIHHVCKNLLCVNPAHMRIGRTDPVKRFWKYVQKGEGCWLWTGARHRILGYGRFQIGTRKSTPAHRYAYEIATGVKPPDHLEVMHDCDNRPCVNPAHLRLGTHQDNMRDAANKGRMRNRRVLL